MKQEINKQLDVLFEQWIQKFGLENFCPDGLMYKGEKTPVVNEKNGKTYWYRQSGKEEEMWNNVSKRVLFLLKDVNEVEGANIRERTGREDDNFITNRFYKNIALWLYGLLNVDDNGIAPAFNTITSEEYTDFFDKTPFAYVNCKKEAGGGSILNDKLEQAIETYKEFIVKEIRILEPDIIVCGGGQHLIKKFVEDYIFDDLTKTNDWMYYSKKDNKLIIDSYHPSYYTLSYEYIYTQMMDNYKSFLDKHPEFRNPACADL